ncbi:MAG: hypothetical protein LC630_03750, partial [Bacteroidales bacterium]|nr:hypothetical protein [Bacteroidales bacterium]
MRPGRILLFLLSVTLTLFILSLVIARLRTGRDPLLHESYTDTLAHHEETHDTLFSDTVLKDQPAADVGDQGIARDSASASFPASSSSSAPVPASAEAGMAPATVRAPYYPGDALRDSLAEGRQVRILYFGDSQIEGDRVTSMLRQKLRAEGGGTGPG